MTRHPTIKDLAEAAGVGIATVDRVLNDRPNVRDTTIERVLLAAERIRLQEGLVEALIPASLVRRSADMIATYEIHRGSLNNQLNSITNLESAFDSLDATLGRMGGP